MGASKNGVAFAEAKWHASFAGSAGLALLEVYFVR